MPRRPRFIEPEVPHHITQRGNHREDVFLSDHDRRRYIEILRIQFHRHEIKILAWCLMTNHVHFIAIPPDPESLGLALGCAHSQYTQDWNRRNERQGHLWHSRYFSCSLTRAHLREAMRYVDLNPVRSGLVRSAQQWTWSSAAAHSIPGTHDPLLAPDWRDWLAQAHLGAWDFEHWRLSLEEGTGTFTIPGLSPSTKSTFPQTLSPRVLSKTV